MRTSIYLPQLTLAVAVTVVAVTTSFAQDDPPDVLQLKTGPLSLQPKPSATPPSVAAESDDIVPPGDDREMRFIVQFNSLPTTAEKVELESMGLKLDQYLDGTSFYASGSSAVATLNSENIRSISVLTADTKVSPDLASERMTAEESQTGRADVTIEVFDPASLERVAATIKALDGEVVNIRRAALSVTARISLDQVNSLAGSDDVKFIAPAPTPPEQFNDGIRANTHADALQDVHGLTGEGVVIGVWDGGRVGAHVDFGGRLTIAEPAVSVSDHATHVAGTLGGDGTGSAATAEEPIEILLLSAQSGQPPATTAAGRTMTTGEELTTEEKRAIGLDDVAAGHWRGVAPGVGIVSFLWDDAADDHEGAIATHGIDLSQNSWGFAVDENIHHNCSDYGDYTADAAAYDRIVRGLFGRPLPVIFAAGNERNDNDCGLAPPPADNFAIITPPQTAKNVIAVGAINSDDDSLTDFTSYGPTDDGRLKPDLVSAGCEANGASVITSTLPGDRYGGKCGTSMAAPAVSGVIALLMERRRRSGSAEALPSSYKAILVHSADDIDAIGPDYRSGYGKMNAERALEIVENSGLTEATITESGRTLVALLDVEAGRRELKVTLCWDDEPAATNAISALVNDLDLRLVAPDGTAHGPWILDPGNPAQPATRGRDGINVLEQVQVANPGEGQWRIEIAGTFVPKPPQAFSLVVSTD